MEIAKQIFKLVFVSILLLFTLLVLRQPHKAFYEAEDEYIYSTGSAPAEVRAEILGQLKQFQAGYTRRDLDQVETFIQEVFSQENLLVLGTMPDEIFHGQEEVSDLIYSDWNAWGDVTFLMDNANISSNGDTAWIATIGYVRFDLPRFLVLPLRLSGVMVNESSEWKFQFLQFQFDLSLFFLFFTTILISIWWIVSLAGLILTIIRRLGMSRNINAASHPGDSK
jgi:hypothetical protein